MYKGLLFFFLAAAAWGQSSTRVAPDCTITFSFTATARTPAAGFANGSTAEPGCVTWTIVYYSTGFSALSLRLDSAPDSSGAAGTWGAFSGTLLSGINPNTATTQAFTTIFGYNPWVSVNLTSVTGSGTIRGVVYGWKVPSQVFATTTSSGAAQDVNLIKVGGAAIALGQAAMAASVPVVVASNQTAIPVSLSGNQAVNVAQLGGNNIHTDTQGNAYQFLGCTSQAEVALSGTGYVEIVAGTAAQVIRVCKVFVTSASGGAPVVNTFSIARATVTTCASATELLNAAGVTGLDMDFGGALQSGSGQSICVSESTANSDKVTIVYAKF
jgi:carbon monoxide dehydrogenase subunit G